MWLDLDFDRHGQLPSVVSHRVTTQVPPGLPVPETITATGATTKVDLRAPVILSPPLQGDQWAAAGSCCDGPHRRALQPVKGNLHLGQRFAIDFNRLTPDHRLRSGDATLNESYPTYDQPVLAVADGTVVTAVDRFEDQVPLTPRPVTLEEAEGNHVVLDLGDGRFAFYAHLRPGSVRVEEGQRVRSGEVLARTGNSGSSTGPHLHFHVMDAPSPLVSDGLPYAFNRFDLTGRTPSFAELEPFLESGEPVPIDVQGAGARRDVLPLGRDVVAFPG